MGSTPVYSNALKSEAHKEILALGGQVNAKFKSYQNDVAHQLLQEKEQEIRESFEKEKVLLVEELNRNARKDIERMENKLAKENAVMIKQRVSEAVTKERARAKKDMEIAKCEFQHELEDKLIVEREKYADDLKEKISEIQCICDKDMKKTKEEMKEINLSSMEELRQKMKNELKKSLDGLEQKMIESHLLEQEELKIKLQNKQKESITNIENEFQVKANYLKNQITEKDVENSHLANTVKDLEVINVQSKEKLKCLMKSFKDLIATCKSFDMHHCEFVLDGIVNDFEMS